MKKYKAKEVSPFHAPTVLAVGSLTECRRAIVAAVKEVRAQRPGRAIHQNGAAMTMQAGDYLELTYSKHGYHVAAVFKIDEVRA